MLGRRTFIRSLIALAVVETLVRRTPLGALVPADVTQPVRPQLFEFGAGNLYLHARPTWYIVQKPPTAFSSLVGTDV